MVNTITLSFLILLAISILLIFNEFTYRRLDIRGEITRKFAHFAATLATLPFPYIFTDHWYVLVLALIFFAVLFISKNGTQLKSIHDIDRKSVGSYLLPLSIYITFLISWLMEDKFFYILPMLILAVCDPMAGILGMNIKKNNHNIKILGHKTKKTILGSGSFLVSCFIISIISLYYKRMAFDLETFYLSLIIAVVSTVAEFLSWRGTDNLSIPLSVLLVLVIFL